MKTPVSDYLFSPLVWIQIIILFLLLTLLALVLTPLGPLLGAWAGNTFVKELTIEGVRGSLLNRIDIEKIEWRDTDVITLTEISLEPGRPDFSINQLPIEILAIQSLEIELSPNAKPRQRGELVNIGDFGTSPVNFLVKSGKLGQVKVLEAGKGIFQMSNMILDGTEAKDDQLSLNNASVDMVIGPETAPLVIPNATMNMLAPHEININGDLAWQHPDVGDVSAKLHLYGLLQSYNMAVDGDIAHPELGRQDFTLEAKGDFDHLNLQRLTLGGNSGSLLSNGEIAWVPSLSADLNLTASNLKTAQFMPEWPADLTGELTLKVAQENDKLRGGLAIETLTGTLRGYPFNGSGNVSMLNNELLFEQLEIRSSNNVVKINGRGSEPFDLKWDINGRDLSKMMPGIAGRVSAKGTLTGSMNEPMINGDLNTTRLSFQGNKLDSGDLKIQTVDGQFQLDGRFHGLLINGERIMNATLSGKGDVDQHSINLAANHTLAKVSASVDGTWDGQRWLGTLRTAEVNDQTFGQWKLQKPSQVTVSSQGVIADKLCMVATDGSACTNINYTQQGGFHTSGKLANAPLQMLNPLLPELIKLDGRVAGAYEVSLDPELKGKAELSFVPGQLVLSQEGVKQRIGYRTGMINADIDGNTVKADTRFNLIDGGLINSKADITFSPSDGKHRIDAEGEFKTIPLALGRAFLPPEMAVSGLANGAFVVKQEGDKRSGKLLLDSQNLQFTYTDKAVGRQRYQFNQVNLNATLQGDQLQADTQLSLATGGSLEARAAVDLSKPDLIKAIIAEGQVQTMPLALLRPYLPQGVDADGLVSGSFKVRQEAGEPVGEVDLTASNGAFVYKPVGQTSQQYRYNSAKIQASIRGDQVDGDVAFDLKNGGQFSGQAAVDLSQPDLMKSINAKGKMDAIPLAMVRPYFPKAFDIDGLISGEYSVSQRTGETVGQVNLLSNGGRFSYDPAGGTRQTYQYRTVQVQGALQGDKLLADIGLELKDGGILSSKVSADISSFDKDPIFTAEGTIKEIPMALAQPYLPKPLSVNGRINAEYQIQQQGRLKGNVRLDLPTGSFTYHDENSGAQTYRYRRAEVVADIDGDIVDTDLQFVLQDGGSFSTKGRLDLSQADNLFAFEGAGRFDSFPLALVQPYLPVPVTFKGVAEGSYQLSQKGGQQGKVELKLPASSFIVEDSTGKPQAYEYKSGSLSANINGKSVVADVQLALKGGGVIDGAANIVLGTSAKSHRINIDGKLASVPLALLEPYLPEDLSFPGNINGNYSLSQRSAKLAGKVNLSLPNSFFVVETASGEKQSFAYEQGVLNTTIDGDRINVGSTLVFKGKGDLRARAQIVLREKGDPSINGVAEVNVPNIFWAQAYVPYSRGLRGQVVGKVNFSGLVSKPRVTGQLAMSNGYLRLPQLGTEFTDINWRIQADRANQAVIVGSMSSGGGVIKANGRLSLADIKNWTAQMSLSGNNIKFVDTHEAKAYMTPNLQINANPKAVVIRGTIDIPTADINLKDLPEFSIDESEDVIVMGETVPGSTINAVRMQPNILVRLGNNVRFKGFGFQTRLVGGLRVTNSRNTIVTNGSLNILEGRYEAYGQDLKIENGRLVFNGPPKNVGVDVRAIREVDSGEVGMHLTGTIQKLKSTLFSDPVMQETDALSYLVTGHSLASATGRETALLMQAVRGLGIDGSDGLIQRIGKSIGLDDLSIVTRDDFRESELQLGKKLGSKLYVRYLVGLFDSAHRIAMDYKINKYLNLEIQAGEEQSLDLIYEYEKD